MTRAESFAQNKAFSDRVMPLVETYLRRLLSDHSVVKLSTLEEDYSGFDATLVCGLHGKKIAVRVRKADKIHFARQDFTIRYPTELQKLRNNAADYMFYACLNTSETDFAVWYLIEIAPLLRLGYLDDGVWRVRNNTDGTRFIAIPVDIARACGALVLSHENYKNAMHLGTDALLTILNALREHPQAQTYRFDDLLRLYHFLQQEGYR